MNRKIASVSTLALVALLASCGAKPKDGKDSSASEGTMAPDQLIDIGVSVTNGKGLGLVAAASAFSISIEGCATGYSSLIDQNSASAKVYRFDRGCLAKLNSLQFNGVNYQPDPAQAFASYGVGEVAYFQDVNNPSAKLKIVIGGQLNSPISGNEQIKYAFEEIQAGASGGLSQSDVSDSHSIEVGGEAAPAFSIGKVLFQGISAQGAGEFVIKLDCEANIAGSGLGASCRGQGLSGLKYRLVGDTFGGSLSLAEAKAAMQAGASSIAAGEVIGVGADLAAPHGGFATKLLSGPAMMHSNPHMILILESNGVSYRYFNIDISTL